MIHEGNPIGFGMVDKPLWVRTGRAWRIFKTILDGEETRRQDAQIIWRWRNTGHHPIDDACQLARFSHKVTDLVLREHLQTTAVRVMESYLTQSTRYARWEKSESKISVVAPPREESLALMLEEVEALNKHLKTFADKINNQSKILR